MKHPAIRSITIVITFIILGSAIYSNTLNVPFQFDDVRAILKNRNIRATELAEIGNAGFKSSYARPIAYMSFALNYYFHQYDVKGYHVVNIVIHILTGLFLYLFVKITLNLTLRRHRCDYPSAIPFFVALIWFVHPIQIQSVTYIVQRMTSMSAMFYLLSFLFYIRGRMIQRERETQRPGMFIHSTRRLYFLGSVLSWILAMGCKQIAATLPFFILLYEWFFFKNWTRNG